MKNNVVEAKLAFTAHLSNRRRILKEFPSLNEEEENNIKLKNRKLNEILCTIVQKWDDIAEKGDKLYFYFLEPSSAVFQGIEFNIIKEQFKANKMNYLSQLLQKYDDTPIDDNNLLIKLINEL